MKHSKIEARVRAILDTRVRRGVSRWETLAATAVALSLLGSLSIVRAAAARPFADLPSVTSQEITIQEQTPTQKRTAALHAKHLKAISARLHVKQKEYETAVLRVQHLQSSIEQLQQKLGKTKTTVVYWKLPGANGKTMQLQIREEQGRLQVLQKQLSEAQQLKERAMLDSQRTGSNKALALSQASADDVLAQVAQENKREAEAQQNEALAEVVTATAVAKSNAEQAKLLGEQDKRAAEMIAALTSQRAIKGQAEASRKMLLDAQVNAELAKAKMTIRDVQNATKQSAEASSEITQKLFAEAAAKQGLHQAQAELPLQASGDLAACSADYLVTFRRRECAPPIPR